MAEAVHRASDKIEALIQGCSEMMLWIPCFVNTQKGRPVQPCSPGVWVDFYESLGDLVRINKEFPLLLSVAIRLLDSQNCLSDPMRQCGALL